VLSRKKEADIHGDRRILLSGRNVGGAIRRVHQIIEKGGGRQPSWALVPCGVFGPKDKLMVFDVWTSQAAFDKFGKTLIPILQQLGLDPGRPSVMPVHKVIVPTAKVTSPRKQAKAAARRKKR
jgi:hypothetical protein